MADVKVSELAVAAAIEGNEQVPVVQGGVTKRTSAESIIASAKTYADNVAAELAEVAIARATDGYVVDDFTTVGAWSAGTGSPTIAHVTDDAKFAQAMRVTTAVGTESHIAREFVYDLAGKFVSFWFKAEDANFERMRLDLTVAGRSTTKQWSQLRVLDALTTGPTVLNFMEGVWKRVTIPLGWLTADGASPPIPAQTDDIRLLRMRITPKSGVAASFLLADLRIHDDPYPDGAVIFVFDDGRDNTRTVAKPILDAAGYTGTISVETANVGTGGMYIDLAPLQAMEAEGWEAISHGANGIGLVGQTLVTIQSELRDSYDWLIANGFNQDSAKFHAYVGGSWDQQVYDETLRHYRAARAIIDHRAETPVVADPGLLRNTYCDSAKTVTTVKTILDGVANRGGIAILTFHSLVETGATGANWLVSNFQEVVTHASSLGLPAIKFREAWPRPF